MIEILLERAVVQIKGADSQKFLQGMVTNDIVKHTYSYNYLLNNQGKYLFDFFVLKQKDGSYLLDIHKDSLDIFLKRLNLYKLRSNIEINDLSDEYNVFYSKIEISSDMEFSLKDPRYKKLGYRSYIKSSNIDKLLQTTRNLYISDKYKYTIIDGNTDLVFERSMPIEYGGEELHAISYQKGCYVGQEVVSRIKYQGVVRKKIFKLIFGAKIVVNLQGAAVIDMNDNQLGIVCSNYKDQAIALLREESYLNLERKIARIENQLVDIAVPCWQN